MAAQQILHRQKTPREGESKNQNHHAITPQITINQTGMKNQSE
jgi:hypothetical protein